MQKLGYKTNAHDARAWRTQIPCAPRPEQYYQPMLNAICSGCCVVMVVLWLLLSS
jgi:hypothetical protein